MSDQERQHRIRLRDVPSIDQLLRTREGRELGNLVGLRRLTVIARSVTAEIRAEIRSERGFEPNNGGYAETLFDEALKRIAGRARSENQAGIKPVINATGVLLHTNLGRAPLSEPARAAVDQAARYCSVEYDIESGGRGGRAARVESLLKDLTGAEDALVVNNCAAAAFLILTVLAGKGETIVSRGELVEIGGDFRVPEIMASSGTRMIEVGTTNRTHLQDYQRAITPNTRLIMRVHPSNYRIVGFASVPDVTELAALARENGVPLYEDAGSGQMQDLRQYGVIDEPVVRDVVANGVDVVSFSGDKLLGSAQAGLIAGTQAIVSRLRKHPLYRALRSDKLRLAALEATLISHQRGAADKDIPLHQMLSLTAEQLHERATSLVGSLDMGHVKLELVAGESALGGGAGPTSTFPTTLIAVTHPERTAQEIEAHLRRGSPPIIARISDDRVLLDLRTVFEDQLPAFRDALHSLKHL